MAGRAEATAANADGTSAPAANGRSRGGAVGLYRARHALRARLELRRPEIEEAILARLYGIADPGDADPAYIEGMRNSVSVALDYALEAVERGEERTPPPPPALLAQARLAARNRVGLDTVLRRYVAGYTLIGDFLAAEVANLHLPRGTAPGQLLQGAAALLDRLLAAVSEEYERETAGQTSTLEQRRAERIERLLAGEPVNAEEFGYDFGFHHVGIVGVGSEAADAVRGLADGLDCRLLLVQPEEQTAWAWLGSRRAKDPIEVESVLASASTPSVTIAIGEAAEDLTGWRLTHRQAVAALPVAQRRRDRVVRYADVALLASILQDDLLATSLRELYLAPLEGERDGGETLRQTLRAYFASERNVSSSAAALGVDRHTVTSRLRMIESRLGRPLASCAADLEAALRLLELGDTAPLAHAGLSASPNVG